MSATKSFHPKSATLLAHAGGAFETGTGGIVPSISPATTYVRDEQYTLPVDEFSYYRSGSPNWRYVEDLMRELEGGADALLFSSGLSASTVIFHTLEPGDHVVIPTAMYHGMRDWLKAYCARWGMAVDEYAAGDLDALASVIRSGSTRIVWIESPANPTWEVTDIREAARLAHEAGALSVVDSTVCTPLITRPLALGADYVVHSATKYLNGHSDVLGGVLICQKNDERWQRIRQQRTGGGAVMGAFEAWLLLRGMRTLDVRLRRACDNAMALAEFLSGHPAVEAVQYPGLASHPGHTVAATQMRGGFGGMLSVTLKDGEQAASHVARHTRIFRPATSLGGVESLIEHRALIEGIDSPTPRNLLRLSAGIEAESDLMNDLAQALEGCTR